MGAGCAGLSLLMRLIRSGLIEDKKILLIEKEPKTKNDRTWCFWEILPGFFEDTVCKTWNHLWFRSPGYSSLLDIAPYQYKMIRAGEFYEFCFREIKSHPNIDLQYAEVLSMEKKEGTLILQTSSGSLTYESGIVFNSIFQKPAQNPGKHYLLQHFKGWMVETEKDAFNPEEAVFMDFRVEQWEGLSFVYLLPLSKRRALIEYTQFTRALLENSEYEERLGHYINQFLEIRNYSIVEKEFGIIPMTNHPFPKGGNGIWNIGSAGGQTKASTGYTFQFIQKQAEWMVEALKKNPLETQLEYREASRFNFYDSVLLNILDSRTLEGRDIFTRLFQKNRASGIFRFLDNESKFPEELSIIHTLPTLPFTKAAFVEIWNGFRN